jgi:hypothetical protein
VVVRRVLADVDDGQSEVFKCVTLARSLAERDPEQALTLLREAGERAHEDPWDPAERLVSVIRELRPLDREAALALAVAAAERAKTVSHPAIRAQALTKVAVQLVELGQLDAAVRLVDAALPEFRAEILDGVARALAAAGDPRRAAEVARSIADPIARGLTLATVAKTGAEHALATEAEQLVAESPIAGPVASRSQRERAWTAILEAYAAAGDWEAAERVAIAHPAAGEGVCHERFDAAACPRPPGHTARSA